MTKDTISRLLDGGATPDQIFEMAKKLDAEKKEAEARKKIMLNEVAKAKDNLVSAFEVFYTAKNGVAPAKEIIDSFVETSIDYTNVKVKTETKKVSSKDLDEILRTWLKDLY